MPPSVPVPAPPGLTPAAEAALCADLQRLWQCLNLLGERARDVVLRTFVQGEGGPEIAVAVGISEANVRAIRHRAVVALRDCVHEGRP